MVPLVLRYCHRGNVFVPMSSSCRADVIALVSERAPRLSAAVLGTMKSKMDEPKIARLVKKDPWQINRYQWNKRNEGKRREAENLKEERKTRPTDGADVTDLRTRTGVESKHKQDILRNAKGKMMKTEIEGVPCDQGNQMPMRLGHERTLKMQRKENSSTTKRGN